MAEQVRSLYLRIVALGALASILQLGNFPWTIPTDALPEASTDSLVGNSSSNATELELDYRPRIVAPSNAEKHSESHFSACLLVKDDNHFLVEWMAYHHLMLPLRRLIVAVDPKSKTSPQEILDRYSKRGLMNITIWNDEHYINNKTAKRFDRLRGLLGKDNNRNKSSLRDHRDRQSYFNLACMRQLKIEGNQNRKIHNISSPETQWVILIDTDEFILPSPHTGEYFRINGQESENATIHSILDEGKRKNATRLFDLMHLPCINTPRVRFGAKESSHTRVQNLVPKGFRGRSFLTFRWRWRAFLHDRQSNHATKAMVDVMRVPFRYLKASPRLGNPHRPVSANDTCPKSNLFRHHHRTPFVIHHYVGTREQYTFRDDARDYVRRESDYEEFSKIQRHEDDSIRPWLERFVGVMGSELASKLLKGVGEIEKPMSTTAI